MIQGTKTKARLAVLPSTVNDMELGYQLWRDALFLSYDIDPPDLTTHCDGYNAKNFICHSLDCKKSGFITTCHKDLRSGFADLAGKAFTPTRVI